MQVIYHRFHCKSSEGNLGIRGKAQWNIIKDLTTVAETNGKTCSRFISETRENFLQA